MELPDEYTLFWAAQVISGDVCKVTIPDGDECTLTNAAIAQAEEHPDSGRAVLMAKVNDGDNVAIIPFTINGIESAMLDLQFNEGDVIEFTVSGINCTIHVSGYSNGGCPIIIENAITKQKALEKAAAAQEEEDVVQEEGAADPSQSKE